MRKQTHWDVTFFGSRSSKRNLKGGAIDLEYLCKLFFQSLTCCCCCCGRCRCCYCLLLLLLLWLLLFANKESFHSTPSFDHPLMSVIVKSAFLGLSASRERWFFSLEPVCVVIRFFVHPLPGNVVDCRPQSNVKWFAFTKVCCIDEVIQKILFLLA